MSFCTNLQNFIQIGLPWAEKIMSYQFSRWRISTVLNFRGPIMGSLKSRCTTSYRSSIDTIALNCLVFEKLHFCIFATHRQTYRRTDGQARCMKLLSLLRAAAYKLPKKTIMRTGNKYSILFIGQTWRYINCQNGGRPPSWNYFSTIQDHPQSLCCWLQLPVKFHVNLIQIWRYSYLNFSHIWLEMPIQSPKMRVLGTLDP